VTKGIVAAGAIAALALTGSVAQAGLITGATAANAKDTAGDPVSAQAIINFDPVNYLISISLDNLLVDPKDAGQNVTGFSFNIAGYNTGAVSLSSSSGTQRTLGSSTPASFQDTAVSSVGWGALTGGNLLGVDWFSRDKTITGQQAQWTLIGKPDTISNEYTQLNGSLDNGAHNPFLAGPLTFNFSAPGDLSSLTANSFSNFQFAFGTSPGDDVGGTPRIAVTAPVPPSLALAGAGMLTLLAGRGLKRVRRQAA
jgi:hypothetical protein